MTINEIFVTYDEWWLIDGRSNAFNLKCKSLLEKDLQIYTTWWTICQYIKKSFWDIFK